MIEKKQDVYGKKIGYRWVYDDKDPALLKIENRVRQKAINELVNEDQMIRGLERKRNWKNDSRRTNMGEKLV